MKKLLLPLILLFLTTVIKAQSVPTHFCGSDKVRDELLKANPELQQVFNINEQQIQNIIQRRKSQRAGETVYKVPVVVHVIHTGEAVGVGTNISDAQINSGITQLNNAFRNTHAQSQDIKIEFELAKKDANCAATTGINRIDGSVVAGYATKGVNSDSTTGASETSIKNLSRWSNSDYYNIWIVSEFDNNNGGGGLQGFAYFPGASSSIDGTMIMHTAWGNQGTANSWNNQGKTIIHEIGHAFNLRHTFEGDGSGSTCPTGNQCGNGLGDCCGDTPPHKRSSSNCVVGTNSCDGGSSTEGYIHNYMDYSSQNCQYLFTPEQKSRMRAALEGPRASLLYSKALDASAPTFVAPTAAACTPTTSATGLGGNFGAITLVQFGTTLSHTSGYASSTQDNGYVNQSNNCQKYAVAYRDSTYKLKITVGINSNRLRAWIDYNNDGDFEDAGESLLNKTGLTSVSDSVNITIPSSAPINTFIRMRVMNDVTGTISNSCYNPTYGQAEDYSIYIKTAAATPPVAAFTANKTTICVGENVTFTDQSTNTPTSWSWTMTGASSAASTSQNPTVSYAAAGTYSVTLQATNSGGNNSLTKTNYITVVNKPTVSVNNAAICSGGTAATFTASAGSGTMPYTYAWTGNGSGTASTTSGTTAGSYTATVTDANNCTATASGTLTVNSLPTVSVNNATICSGAAAATFTATTNATSPTYVWSVNGTGTAATTTGTTAGNYTVTVTDVNSCQASATGVLTVNSLPTVSLSNKSVCSGSSTTFDAGAGFTTYAWSGQGSGTAQTTNASAAGTYTVTVTNANNCSNSASATLTVNTAPTVSVNNNAICSGGAAATFTATAGSGTMPYTYAWTGNGSGTASTTSGTTAGSYTATVTDANNCTATASGTLTVNSLPTVSVNNATICSGAAAATFTATTNATSPTYVWSVNGTGTAATTTGTTAGNYTVTVTDVNSCQASATGVLTVNSLPTVSLSNKSVCSGSSTTFDAGAGFTTYAWSGQGSGTAQTTNASTAGTYTVTVTNANNCSNSASATLTVNTAPTVSVNNNAICSGGAAATFTASVSGGTMPYTYLWSVNGTGTAATTTGTNAGNYTVVVTDANSCSGNGTGVLTINSAPSLASFTSSTNCTSGSKTLQVSNVPAGTTIDWYANSTGGTTLLAGASSYATIVNSTITYYAETRNTTTGCVSTARLPVTSYVDNVIAIPTIANPSIFVCNGKSASLVASVPAGYTVDWYSTISGGTVESGGQGVTTFITPAITGTKSYFAETRSTSTGCIYSGRNSVGITANPLPIITSVAAVNGAACGITSSAPLSVTGLLADQTVDWYSVSSGGTVAAGGTGVTTFNAPYSPMPMGNTYYAEVRTSSTGCVAASRIAVSGTFNTNPTNNISAANVSRCGSGTVTLSVGNPSPGYTYDWYTTSTGGTALSGGTGTSSYTSPSLSSPSVTAYYVEIRDVATGCASTTRTSVLANVYQANSVNLGADQSICSGQTATLSSSGSQSSYAWNTGATSSTINVTNAGSYILTATNSNGCVAKDTVVVAVKTSPTVSVNNASICSGGTAATFTATAGSGTMPYTYVWTGNGSGTASTTSGTASGSYTVTVTDANLCTASASGTLTVNSLPTVSLSNKSVCSGSSTTFDAGAGFTTYAWSGQGSGTAQTTNASTAGTYTVTVTNANNCSNSASGTLTVNSLPTVTANSNFPTTYVQNEGNISLTFGQPSGGTYSGTGVTGSVFNTTNAGVGIHTITYTYTDANNCSNSVTKNLQVDVFTSVARLSAGISAAPNPFNDVLYVRLNSSEIVAYELTDAQGKLVLVGQQNGSQISINTSSVDKGVYYLRLTVGKEQTIYKLIKN